VAGLKIWMDVEDVCAGASWMCDAVAGGVAVPGDVGGELCNPRRL
jgi:hypothetical protein